MSGRAKFKFRLYIAGNAPNSGRALANLKSICRTQLKDRCDIEIVDVFQDPERALADAVFMTPTLVKLAPAPVSKIVGTLSQTETVLTALGLDSLSP